MPYIGLIMLAIMVIALIDILNTDSAAVRGIPKVAWVFVVILMPLIGSLLWLGVGRPTSDERASHPRGAATDYPEYDRPGRYIPADPEADREFLEQIRSRAEEQRRKAREQEKARERKESDGDGTR